MVCKIFYEQPYLTTFKTAIKEVIKKDGQFHIALEETIFYPEGGGQPGDTGFINDAPVLSVYEANNVIWHVVAEGLKEFTLSGSAANGAKVICRLDFGRRLYHMQQHTGQHLLSAVFYNQHKLETTSFHLAEDYASIDLDRPNLGASLMTEVEDAVNDYIRQNLPVKTYLVAKDKVKDIPVRKAPAVDENIRIVELDRLDYSPCCGTHLQSTAELGLLKIIRWENNKQMTRVYFLAGKKALQDYQVKQALLTDLSARLSANEHTLAERVQALLDNAKAAARELKRLKEELFKYKALDITKAQAKKTIITHFEEYNFEDIQLLARNITALGDYIVVFSSGPDRHFVPRSGLNVPFEGKLLIAHNGQAKIDCGKIIKDHIGQYHGRGGGSPKFAQASFETSDDLSAFREFVDLEISKSANS